MTYRELLGYAQKKIDNNEITVGEYMEMTKVLNREVDVLDKIKAEIYEEFMTIDGGVHDESAIKCMQIIDKYKERSE